MYRPTIDPAQQGTHAQLQRQAKAAAILFALAGNLQSDARQNGDIAPIDDPSEVIAFSKHVRRLRRQEIAGEATKQDKLLVPPHIKPQPELKDHFMYESNGRTLDLLRYEGTVACRPLIAQELRLTSKNEAELRLMQTSKLGDYSSNPLMLLTESDAIDRRLELGAILIKHMISAEHRSLSGSHDAVILDLFPIEPDTM